MDLTLSAQFEPPGGPRWTRTTRVPARPVTHGRPGEGGGPMDQLTLCPDRIGHQWPWVVSAADCRCPLACRKYWFRSLASGPMTLVWTT